LDKISSLHDVCRLYWKWANDESSSALRTLLIFHDDGSEQFPWDAKGHQGNRMKRLTGMLPTVISIY
jgi:hypothetical protein